VSGVIVGIPGKGSGGAYIAFKRSAPVYPTASVAVQLTLDGNTCKDAAIQLGCVGLTSVKAKEAEAALRGQAIYEKSVAAAAEAARAAADPQPDMRGSADYKRAVIASLTKRAIDAAARRARGEQVEVSHIYA
jgi:carbon-monoxide dehydrogenase medium subunit